jgi:signal transduction histidine kinase
MAAQKTLLANASHELRSPLARIRMAVELMEEGDGRDARDELRKNIVELDQLIAEILLASRLEAGAAGSRANFESLDFTGLVAEECARVDAKLESGTAELTGDPRLLRRLVRNLLENASRHGGGSPIDVVLTQPDAQHVLLAIGDRGPGIPEAERERVFEPFFRARGTRESDGGVGLGLSLVRAIARKHGGEARCAGRPGGGTSFIVSLRRSPMDDSFQVG